jgi:hypothetical protein
VQILTVVRIILHVHMREMSLTLLGNLQEYNHSWFVCIVEWFGMKNHLLPLDVTISYVNGLRVIGWEHHALKYIV